jgi:hypothetical protein
MNRKAAQGKQVFFSKTNLPAMARQTCRLWQDKPAGYGKTNLPTMARQACRLWQDKPTEHT